MNGAGPLLPPITPNAPAFVRNVLGTIAGGDGDDLPVSAFPNDGTFPTATAQFEKRNLALDIPGVGREDLHPMLEMRGHLPARDHPRQGL